METGSRTRWGGGVQRSRQERAETVGNQVVKLGVWGGTESLNDLNFRIH